MLSQLYIKNIAVISEAEIDFEPRLNIFTGETGAGKTILISAINGVLGARLTKDIIRNGEDRAYISALFTKIPEETLATIDTMGYESEDGTLLISREIGSRNICKVNGRPATLQLLRDISSLLIDIHGQKDNHKLLNPETHISYIDDFGELDSFRSEYQQIYQKVLEVKRKLEQVSKNDREKEHKIDLLNYQINEIESAQLESGEEEALQLKRDQIRNSEKIIKLISESKLLLGGGEETDGIVAMFDKLCENLNTLSHYIPELEELSHKMEDFSYEISDCGVDIGNYLDEIDYEEGALDIIEERLDKIYKLKRKYGSSINEILDFLKKIELQRNEIAFSEEKVQNLQKEYHQLLPDLQAAADNLTSLRHKSAKEFLSRVKRELEFLNMPSVKLSISAGRAGFQPNGQDEMEFLISSNAGEEPKALAKIASGGELSRVMLSIKNVLAEKDQVGTAIFDEIDTGVSGKAAQKIGQKLKEVSHNRQVICVTHLPQVASFADNHLFITKEESGGRTFTQIFPLNAKRRIEEIARMISGENITDTSIKNAEEMILLAQ